MLLLAGLIVLPVGCDRQKPEPADESDEIGESSISDEARREASSTGKGTVAKAVKRADQRQHADAVYFGGTARKEAQKRLRGAVTTGADAQASEARDQTLRRPVDLTAPALAGTYRIDEDQLTLLADGSSVLTVPLDEEWACDSDPGVDYFRDDPERPGRRVERTHTDARFDGPSGSVVLRIDGSVASLWRVDEERKCLASRVVPGVTASYLDVKKFHASLLGEKTSGLGKPVAALEERRHEYGDEGMAIDRRTASGDYLPAPGEEQLAIDTEGVAVLDAGGDVVFERRVPAKEYASRLEHSIRVFRDGDTAFVHLAAMVDEGAPDKSTATTFSEALVEVTPESTRVVYEFDGEYDDHGAVTDQKTTFTSKVHRGEQPYVVEVSGWAVGYGEEPPFECGENDFIRSACPSPECTVFEGIHRRDALSLSFGGGGGPWKGDSQSFLFTYGCD